MNEIGAYNNAYVVRLLRRAIELIPEKCINEPKDAWPIVSTQ